jgi:DNA polymerase III subunit epsilon
MNQYGLFAIEEGDLVTPLAVANSTEWRFLRRLHVPEKFGEPQTGEIKRALVVDVETTGLNLETDDVMQLAMLPFDYEVETGRILTVYAAQAFEALREPAVLISEEASLITGISADMVSGKTVDADAVAMLVETADLVIAHNAKFDRPMVERHWDCFGKKPWACTLDSVDWLREGFSAGKLDYLGMQFGWFYDGHQALADCEACLALLAQTLPNSGAKVMSAVRNAAAKSEWLIPAINAPYDLKDKLKERSYQWRPEGLSNGKVWWTAVEDRDAEVAWLCDEIYGREIDIKTHPITAFNRYSEQLWSYSK